MAFFIVITVATIQWIVDGRKNFTGPRIDKEALQTRLVSAQVSPALCFRTYTIAYYKFGCNFPIHQELITNQQFSNKLRV